MNPARERPALELAYDSRTVIRNIFILCIAAEILFWWLDFFINYSHWSEIGPIRRLFNMTREDGMASWFSIAQTGMVALTVTFIYLTARRRPDCSKWRRFAWLALALFLWYMAADDGSMIHERMGSTFKELQARAKSSSGGLTFGAKLLDFFPSYPWHILFLPIFGSFGLFLFIFMWRELRTLRARLTVLAAICCFIVAVGLDFVEGLDDDDPLNIYTHFTQAVDISDFTERQFDKDPFTAMVHFSKSTEELIEAFGMTLLLTVFVRHWMTLADGARLRFNTAADRGTGRSPPDRSLGADGSEQAFAGPSDRSGPRRSRGTPRST